MPALTSTPSRTPITDRTCWATPPALFERYHRIFRFDLDACALPHNAKLPLYFTPEEDGLARPWVVFGCPGCGRDFKGLDGDGGCGHACPDCGLPGIHRPANVWLNCPYGRPVPMWLEKAWRESQRGALVVALLPDDTSTRWYHDWVKGKAHVEPLEGRVKFVGAPGMPNFGSFVAIYWPAGFWRGA